MLQNSVIGIIFMEVITVCANDLMEQYFTKKNHKRRIMQRINLKRKIFQDSKRFICPLVASVA